MNADTYSKTYDRWNDSIVRYFHSESIRTYYLSLLGLVLPCAWILNFLEFQSTGAVNGWGMGLTVVLTMVVAEGAATRLSWSKQANPDLGHEHLTQAMPQEPVEDQAQRKLRAHQESHQEYRAQGNRVIVDGIAFKYGVSRKHFERAPWYRN